jgi:hypothetical protein
MTFSQLKEKLHDLLLNQDKNAILYIGNHSRIKDISFTVETYTKYIEAIPKRKRKNSPMAKVYKDHLFEMLEAIENNQFKNDVFGKSRNSIYPLTN